MGAKVQTKFEDMAHFGRMLRCAVALLQAEWFVRRQPFSRTAQRLSKPPDPGVAPADPLRVALDIRGALRSVCRRLPWRPTCLVKAIAAQSLLRRGRVPSALVLSVMPSETPTVRAHAWLEAANIVVTGRTEANAYSPVYRFDNSPVTPAINPSREDSSCLR